MFQLIGFASRVPCEEKKLKRPKLKRGFGKTSLRVARTSATAAGTNRSPRHPLTDLLSPVFRWQLDFLEIHLNDFDWS